MNSILSKSKHNEMCYSQYIEIFNSQFNTFNIINHLNHYYKNTIEIIKNYDEIYVDIQIFYNENKYKIYDKNIKYEWLQIYLSQKNKSKKYTRYNEMLIMIYFVHNKNSLNIIMSDMLNIVSEDIIFFRFNDQLSIPVELLNDCKYNYIIKHLDINIHFENLPLYFMLRNIDSYIDNLNDFKIIDFPIFKSFKVIVADYPNILCLLKHIENIYLITYYILTKIIFIEGSLFSNYSLFIKKVNNLLMCKNIHDNIFLIKFSKIFNLEKLVKDEPEKSIKFEYLYIINNYLNGLSKLDEIFIYNKNILNNIFKHIKIVDHNAVKPILFKHKYISFAFEFIDLEKISDITNDISYFLNYKFNVNDNNIHIYFNYVKNREISLNHNKKIEKCNFDKYFKMNINYTNEYKKLIFMNNLYILNESENIDKNVLKILYF